MSQTDFVETYRLRTRNLPKELRGRRVSVTKRMLRQIMKPTTRFGRCRILGEGDYVAQFSSDNYKDVCYRALLLAPVETPKARQRAKGNSLISLAYEQPTPYHQGGIEIQYIQSTNRMTPEIYASLKESLGVNPHEFLLAHFLSRLAPVLDLRPDIGVRFDDYYLNRNGVYQRLRDRFFDKDYNLNPNKARVRQILGEGNAWLEARK